MFDKDSVDWGQARILLAAALLVIVPFLAIFIASHVGDADLRKTIYTGAVTLLFTGLFGGAVKLTIDAAAETARKREADATFVANILSDLKSVYDRVARARVLIGCA
ncbi:hypothetical protein [Caballeronia novacaledonica]|uniref:Uncharacterized protein n=1 Tax=Caballeronia novacaledonica TaxID=1544861 RepID=A0AA37MSJ9_9BURK|nr:hypothetical protein [Caballeronia novacaledonica]GJH26277.1 hypothetical protein CBA19CS42_17195 [Caballeronia novacaledonica]